MRSFVGLLLLLTFHWASALTLNGISSYEQLRKEYYIAALYLSDPSSNPNQILANQRSKRMAIKVTANRWSPRRWALQWQNDIAINNPLSNDPEFTDNLLKFTGFPKDNLTTGDEVLIDYIPGKGTQVNLNGVTVLQTETAQLFDALLNAWIGQAPPSREFKEQILSMDSNSELVTRYESLKYSASRSQLVQQWVDADKQKMLAQKQQKQQQAEARARAQAEQKARQLAQQKAAQEKARKPTYTPPKRTQKPPEKKQKVVTPESTKKVKTAKQIEIEQAYYKDLYRWELRRAVHQSVEYPVWAKQFGQKGLVTVRFDVNRQAEVSNLSTTSPEASDLLVNELKRAVNEVVPFLLPPDSLKGNVWSFTLSYRFDPNESQQAYQAKPKMPETLQSQQSLSRAEYKRVLSGYLDNVKSIIEDSIEYPEWSQRLNQKGMVVYEIDINAEGIVVNTKEIETSRHSALNQAVLDAINISQPLPVIPQGLELNQTSVRIERRF